jgi:hypothetical protein
VPIIYAAWNLNDEVEQLDDSKKWSRKALRSELRRRLGWRSKKEDFLYQAEADAHMPTLYSGNGAGVPQHADGSGGGGRVRGSPTKTTSDQVACSAAKSNTRPREEHPHQHGSLPKSSHWFALRSRRQRSEPNLSTTVG